MNPRTILWYIVIPFYYFFSIILAVFYYFFDSFGKPHVLPYTLFLILQSKYCPGFIAKHLEHTLLSYVTDEIKNTTRFYTIRAYDQEAVGCDFLFRQYIIVKRVLTPRQDSRYNNQYQLVRLCASPTTRMILSLKSHMWRDMQMLSAKNIDLLQARADGGAKQQPNKCSKFVWDIDVQDLKKQIFLRICKQIHQIVLENKDAFYIAIIVGHWNSVLHETMDFDKFFSLYFKMGPSRY